LPRRHSATRSSSFHAGVGLREETVELRDSDTVKDLLEILVAKHGEVLRDCLFDSKTGDLRRSLQFLVGEKPITALDGLSTRLTDGCLFAIIPPVGGG
jgi:molybdopterin converting factor small subunit